MESMGRIDYDAKTIISRRHPPRPTLSVGGVWLMSALTVVWAGCGQKKQQAPPRPTVVEVVQVRPRDVPVYMEWIGTLEGYVNAQIRAQVSGYLLSQNYVEGSQVKQGQLLFQIDPRPFEAVQAQAQAKLAQDQAQLGKTKLDVERLTPLAKAKA